MERRFRQVPGSLNALLVHEAAVRHASFTRAGQELSLTQPTVSRHIATLEARLGCALFERHNNRIQPTAAGRRLADAVSLGLGHTETVWEELARPDRDEDLVLACSFGFADQWLMPRYADLQAALGDRRLRMATSDWMRSLDMDRIDLAVVWDLGHTPDRPSVPLFAEEVFPVCSPDYLRRHPGIAESPVALAEADLLHFDVGASGFLTWSGWFARCGLVVPDGDPAARIDAYPFILRAAQDGAGVVLGWRFLVDRLIADGGLVQVGPAVRNRETAYHLQYRALGPAQDAIQRVVRWFQDAVAAQV